MDAKHKRQRRLDLWATLGAVAMAPLAVVLALFVRYAAAYAGQCDGHPLDIPARPCTFLEYLGDWMGDGFALLGLGLLTVPIALGAALIGGLVWLVTWHGRRAEIRRSYGGSP